MVQNADLTLVIELETVTPMYTGGAEPESADSFRLPSLKGALRFWYRALDGDFRTNEPAWFGSTEGQSPVALRLVATPGPDLRMARLDTHQLEQRPGLSYLGYNDRMKLGERSCVPPRTGLTLEFTLQPRVARDQELAVRIRRAWIAALWCVAHIGGLGARSRRGFGSIRVKGVRGWGDEAQTLFLSAYPVPNPGHEMTGALKTLRSWFAPHGSCDHPILDDDCRIATLPSDNKTWGDALDDAGQRLKEYRQQLNKEDHPLAPGTSSGAPRSAAFGLPLLFAVGKRQTITLNPDRGHRQPSALFLRIGAFQIPGSAEKLLYRAVFVRVSAPFLGSDNAPHSVKVSTTPPWLYQPLTDPDARRRWAASTIDAFLNECEAGFSGGEGR